MLVGIVLATGSRLLHALLRLHVGALLLHDLQCSLLAFMVYG